MHSHPDPDTRAEQPLPHVPLTPREIEALTLIVGGLKNRDIAATLVISEHTLAHHLTAVYRKLGCKGRLQAAVIAVHLGLAEPDTTEPH